MSDVTKVDNLEYLRDEIQKIFTDLESNLSPNGPLMVVGGTPVEGWKDKHPQDMTEVERLRFVTHTIVRGIIGKATMVGIWFDYYGENTNEDWYELKRDASKWRAFIEEVGSEKLKELREIVIRNEGDDFRYSGPSGDIMRVLGISEEELELDN